MHVSWREGSSSIKHSCLPRGHYVHELEFKGTGVADREDCRLQHIRAMRKRTFDDSRVHS